MNTGKEVGKNSISSERDMKRGLKGWIIARTRTWWGDNKNNSKFYDFPFSDAGGNMLTSAVVLFIIISVSTGQEKEEKLSVKYLLTYHWPSIVTILRTKLVRIILRRILLIRTTRLTAIINVKQRSAMRRTCRCT